MPPDRHAGVLVPWANSVVEAELPASAAHAVTWHFARLVPPGGGTALDAGFLSGLVEAIPQALYQMSRLPLERTYLACTSAAFTHPDRRFDAVVTAFDAIVAGLRRAGARSVALATPYPARVTAAEAALLGDHGFEVTGAACLDLADGYASVGCGEITALVDRIGADAVEAADAVVLSCTGWPTLEASRLLGERYGRPVLSSNAAIVQHMLQEAPGAPVRR